MARGRPDANTRAVTEAVVAGEVGTASIRTLAERGASRHNDVGLMFGDDGDGGSQLRADPLQFASLTTPQGRRKLASKDHVTDRGGVLLGFLQAEGADLDLVRDKPREGGLNHMFASCGRAVDHEQIRQHRESHTCLC